MDAGSPCCLQAQGQESCHYPLAITLALAHRPITASFPLHSLFPLGFERHLQSQTAILDDDAVVLLRIPSLISADTGYQHRTFATSTAAKLM